MNEELKPKIEFSPDQIPNTPEVNPAEEVAGSDNLETQSPETQTAAQEESHDEISVESSEQPPVSHEVEGIEPHTLNDRHHELAREKVYASSSELESAADASELMDLVNLIEEKPTEQEARDRLNGML